MRIAAVVLLLFGLALPARAVIVASGDGQGNTGAPPDGAPTSHVGRSGKVSAVYLGDGWVLSTRHGEAADFVLRDVTYPLVAGSRHELVHPQRGPADLVVFRVTGDPGLAPLPIAKRSERPEPGSEVVLIGRGQNRGEPVLARGGRLRGWRWGPGFAMRWGTNRVAAFDVTIRGTQSFATTFDPPGSPLATVHECQAALGDSGGAVFAHIDGAWHLLGILFAVTQNGSALFGHQTWAVDLTVYRELVREEMRLADAAPAGALRDEAPAPR